MGLSVPLLAFACAASHGAEGEPICCSTSGFVEAASDGSCPGESFAVESEEDCTPGPETCSAPGMICCQGDVGAPHMCEDGEPTCPPGMSLVPSSECRAPVCRDVGCCDGDLIDLPCGASCPDGSAPGDPGGCEAPPTPVDYLVCNRTYATAPEQLLIRAEGCCPEFACESFVQGDRLDLRVRSLGDSCDCDCVEDECLGEFPVECSISEVNFPELYSVYVNGEPGWQFTLNTGRPAGPPTEWCLRPGPEPSERVFEARSGLADQACLAGLDAYRRPVVQITNSCGSLCQRPGVCSSRVEPVDDSDSWRIVVSHTVYENEEGGACPAVCVETQEVCPLPDIDMATVSEVVVENAGGAPVVAASSCSGPDLPG